MLSLSRKPDFICTELFNASFVLAIERLKEEDEEYFKENFYNTSKVLSQTNAIEMLDKLWFFNQIPGVFSINEYHYALIYDALYHYCFLNRSSAILIKGTKICKLDIDLMTHVYFWCDDFDNCFELEEEPSEEQMEIKEIREDRVLFLNDIGPYFSSESIKYPDLKDPQMLVTDSEKNSRKED